ncbi:MAG: adaptor protein MecA [Eubacterium sp.]|nr:adaptor protein MecA [Eubacterium sp.]
MKIERISDNQIRCTLSKHDLVERHLKISELAYGSERAKELFRDMMEQANIDFGFDAEDIPLMIEAIPTSRESLVLVITKVDNPHEFDEKFANFRVPGEEVSSDGVTTDYEDPSFENDVSDSFAFDDLLDCFDKMYEEEPEDEEKDDKEAQFIPLTEALQGVNKDRKSRSQKRTENIHERIKVYSFVSINPIIEAAHRVTPSYTGKNTVWKDVAGKKYYLLLNRGNGKHAFHSVCSTMSEYGAEEPVTYATQDYFNEHFRVIIKDKALAQLAKL